MVSLGFPVDSFGCINRKGLSVSKCKIYMSHLKIVIVFLALYKLILNSTKRGCFFSLLLVVILLVVILPVVILLIAIM